MKQTMGEQLKEQRVHREIGKEELQRAELHKLRHNRANSVLHDSRWRLEMRRLPPGSECKNRQPGGQVVIPDSVLTNRAWRMSQEPRDITAAVCGDPLPGRSALDIKRGWYA
jgi:hypothetical protein